MAVGMTMAAVTAANEDDAGKDKDAEDDDGDKTQTAINLCVDDGQPWACRGRLGRRFGRR